MSHLWYRVHHQLFDLLALVGLRDRLRCPWCRAVGTWKPHGGWIDRWRGDTLGVRRWLCKWCGWYRDLTTTARITYSVEKGCWQMSGDGEAPPRLQYTGNANPWAG